VATPSILDIALLFLAAILGVAAAVFAVRLAGTAAQVSNAAAIMTERDQTIAAQIGAAALCESAIRELRDEVASRAVAIAGLEERERTLGETIVRLTKERDAGYLQRDEAVGTITTLRAEYERVSAYLTAKEQTIADDEQRVAGLKAQMAEIFEAKARAVIEIHATQFSKSADEKQAAIDGLLKPVQENLTALHGKVEELEKTRAAATTELKTTINELMRRTDSLQIATTTLSTSLTGSSQARGRWGELHLDNLLERSGMSSYCDRDAQETFRDLDGGGRPDVLIRIPDVDYRAYLDATEEGERRAALTRHARAMDGHARALGSRNYGRFDGIAPMTIMYVPNEGMLAATFAEDPDIWERCAERGIYLASPLTLLLQLRAYAAGWQVVAQEENAKLIAGEATELYHRLATFTQALGAVGRGLATTTTAFIRATASY
jgi:DNA recombination protein RmuC